VENTVSVTAQPLIFSNSDLIFLIPAQSAEA
jgi:hypothetical protein